MLDTVMQSPHPIREILDQFSQIPSLKALLRHADYQRHLPELEKWVGALIHDFSMSTKPMSGHAVRVVHWNIERGKNFSGILEALRSHAYLRAADVIILTEADIGMARSGNVHVPQALARALGFHFVFANSSLCIAKGVRDENDVPGENALGLHGVALLSRWPIARFTSIKLPNWIDPMEGVEKRLGQRQALACVLNVAEGFQMGVVGVHIEAKSTTQHRRQQLDVLLREVNALFPKTLPVLVGGDLNTHTLNTYHLWQFIKHALWQGMHGMRERIDTHLLYPEKKMEPIFKVIEPAGFDYAAYNPLGEPTMIYDSLDPVEKAFLASHLPKPFHRWVDRQLQPWDGKLGFKLDWFMGRNLRVLRTGEVAAGDFVSASPFVVADLKTTGQGRLSDHRPIGVDLAVWS